MLNPPAIGGIVSFGINLEKASRYERRKRRPVTRLFEREREQRAESAARFPFDRTSGGPKKEKEYRISAEMGRIVTSDREDFSRMRNKNGTWNYSESMHRIVLRLIRPRERRGISICNCAKRVKKGRTKQAKQKAWTRGNWKFWDREPSEMTHRNDDPCNPSLHPSFVFDSAIPRSLHSRSAQCKTTFHANECTISICRSVIRYAPALPFHFHFSSNFLPPSAFPIFFRPRFTKMLENTGSQSVVQEYNRIRSNLYSIFRNRSTIIFEILCRVSM